MASRSSSVTSSNSLSSHPSRVTRIAAAAASRPAEELLQFVSHFLQRPAKIAGRFVRRLALGADTSHKPLRKTMLRAPPQSIRLDSHIDETSDCRRCVVRMERAEHQVPGQRRLDGGSRRFVVADFTDHDDVGVLSQQRAQALEKVSPTFSCT